MTHDEFAARFTAQYELFLFALTGRYQQVRAPGIEITPRAVVDLQKAAHTLAQTFCESASLEIDNCTHHSHEDASEAIQGLLMQRKMEFEALVRGMVADNLKQVTLMARTGMGSIASLLRGASGAIGLLAQRQAGLVRYKVTDTSGRSWDALTLMRFAARDFAYQSDVDVQVETFAELGVDLLQLSNGQLVSIHGLEGYAWLNDVRARAFHPNATTTMEAYVPT